MPNGNFRGKRINSASSFAPSSRNKMGGSRAVNPFVSVNSPEHQAIIEAERASFFSTKRSSAKGKKYSISEIRQRVAKKSQKPLPVVKETLADAAKNAGVEQAHLKGLLEGYNQLLARYQKIPFEKITLDFLLHNLPTSSPLVRSVPQRTIVAFANFASNNKYKFVELQPKKPKPASLVK